jgi:hypothetical protein
MHLCESEGLLGESARYFVCLYEHFQFKETQLLKDYLDFIVHEPVEWLKAFPERLKTKSSFAKPKSALIKLLKHERVIQALGEEYLKNIHDVIWVTFKKHGDAILASRQKTDTIEHVEEYDSDNVSEQKPSLLIHDCDIEADAVSMDSARLPSLPNNAEKRCALLTNLVRTLIRDYEGSCPALVTVTLQLLDEISKPQNEIL